jgi:hypothetical protein
VWLNIIMQVISIMNDYEAAKSCSQSNMRGTSLTQPELLEGLGINIKIQQNQQALDIPRP